MKAPPGKVALVVSHGSLALGLVSAMEKVVGPQPNVFALSNDRKSPTMLENEIAALIAAEAPGKDVYLLTDMPGGSCATACLRTARTAGVSGVFYGANLTLLLEFVLHQALPPGQFLETVLAKARSSVAGISLCEGDAAIREQGPPGAEGGAIEAGARAGA